MSFSPFDSPPGLPPIEKKRSWTKQFLVYPFLGGLSFCRDYLMENPTTRWLYSSIVSFFESPDTTFFERGEIQCDSYLCREIILPLDVKFVVEVHILFAKGPFGESLAIVDPMGRFP